MKRWRSLVLFIGLLAVAFSFSDWSSGWVLYGAVAFGLLAVKGLAATTALPAPPPTKEHWLTPVTVVVPCFNEDPVALTRCIDALLDVDQVQSVVLVDDCSTDPTTIDAVNQYIGSGRVTVIVHETNKGKREAMATAMRKTSPQTPYVVTIDSDTVIHRDTIANAVVEIVYYDRTAAVTGLVRALNWDRNMLTRVQDIRYANAFLWERSAYSRVGSVLCVCGSFTLWRTDLFARYMTPLCEQTFAGKKCTYGDDRHLTNLALRDGWQVRLAENAVADTLVPDRFTHWARQQSRWSRSFIRESWWSLKYLPYGWAWGLAVIEFVTWIVFTAVLIMAFISGLLVQGVWAFGAIAAWIVITSWARSVRWFDARPEARPTDMAKAVLYAPVYGAMHLAFILPIRLRALTTMRSTSWGTRTTGVEVTA